MERSEGQPHITVNDFAWIADAFIFPAIAAYPASASPDVNNATNGDMFVVPSRITNATPEGDWTDHDYDLAVLRNDEWNFFEPQIGWYVRTPAASGFLVYNGTTWSTTFTVENLTLGGTTSGAYQVVNINDYDNTALGTFVIRDAEIVDPQNYQFVIDRDDAPYDGTFRIELHDQNWISNGIVATQIAANTSSWFRNGVSIGHSAPDTLLDLSGEQTIREKAEPSDPDDGASVIWRSNGTGAGDDGDLMIKVNEGGVIKTGTLIDYSALP